MSGHTPGPWHRNIAPAKKYNTVYAGRNMHIAYLATKVLPDSKIEANTNLIAAAPELLEALINLTMFFEPHDGSDSRSLEEARAAIAKAKGEKP